MIEPSALDGLIRILRDDGFEVVGPRLTEGAITYDRIGSLADLPAGWGDDHAPGRYRLRPRDDAALFGYVVGPHSWKKYLFPPRETLLRVHRHADGAFHVEAGDQSPPRRAFIGVRACELAAIRIQDQVFMQQAVPDRAYAMKRAGVFVVAVNCAEPGGTCFCDSMGTGPRVGAGFDLALTEVLADGHHWLAIEAGSEAGEAMLARLETREPGAGEVQAVERVWQEAPGRMGRRMHPEARQVLARGLNHPRWEETAGRCLSCANCTLVCPTCFCAQLEDLPDMEGSVSERVRSWDSCFNGEHSYMIGGPHRSTVAARYRQWLTHKLSTWHDQFGSSGCVGCGRCITWCPVGIDITEEVAAMALDAWRGYIP